MKDKISKMKLVGITSFLIVFSGLGAADTLLNVSYDPTRELYKDYNALFATYWKSKSGKDVTVNQSHGGSGKQARAVIDGLEADVVTLALSLDIDAIADKGGLVSKEWQKRLPQNSAPYTSTIVFLVRKGNPKKIKDWDDLAKAGIEVVTPNPKTSGGARWNYLAAWGFALKKYKNDEAKAKEFVGKIFKNVKVLDTGARGSTTTFLNKGIGDVLITWENEAYLSLKEGEKENFSAELIVPSLSILAEPTVAIVDKNVEKHGTKAVAEEYLKHLYSPEAQDLIAKHFYRPGVEKAAKKHKKEFKAVKLFKLNDVFGSWAKAQDTHFKDGGLFDQIYVPTATPASAPAPATK